MFSDTNIKKLRQRIQDDVKSPLLYSIVYRYADLEQHEDTLCVDIDFDEAVKFAKRYARKLEVFSSDKPSMWIYEWRNQGVINQWEIKVRWKKVK